jgi:hypothetical protein
LAARTAELERRVADLNRQVEAQRQELERSRHELERARADLEATRSAAAAAASASAEEAKQVQAEAAEYKALEDDLGPARKPKIQLGPVTVGGAMRVKYVLGSFRQDDPANGPNRGGNTGNGELDTFRVNLPLEYGDIIGAVEYRWYAEAAQQLPASCSFLHTGGSAIASVRTFMWRSASTASPSVPGPTESPRASCSTSTTTSNSPTTWTWGSSK